MIVDCRPSFPDRFVLDVLLGLHLKLMPYFIQTVVPFAGRTLQTRIGRDRGPVRGFSFHDGIDGLVLPGVVHGVLLLVLFDHGILYAFLYGGVQLGQHGRADLPGLSLRDKLPHGSKVQIFPDLLILRCLFDAVDEQRFTGY